MTNEINHESIEKNYKVYSIDESKDIGNILRTETSRKILKYIIDAEYHNEILSQMIAMRRFPTSNVHHHLQKFKKSKLAETMIRPHPNSKGTIICYRAKGTIIIVRDEKTKKKYEKSKKLQKVLEELEYNKGLY